MRIVDSTYIIFNYSSKSDTLSSTKHTVNILSIFPEPTYVTPTNIIYMNDELGHVIRNNGFVFLGEDMNIKQKSERSTFLWTVLFGTAIAVSIDILVNLILKWKGILPRKRRRKDN